MSQAVRDAAARADDLIRSLAETGLAPKLEEAAPPVSDTIEAEPVVESGDGGQDDQGVAAAPVVESSSTSDDVRRLQDELTLAVNRYEGLQGIAKHQSNQIKQLHELIANMQATPVNPASQDAPLVSKEDEEAFGAELIDVARRVARQEQLEQAKKYDARFAQIEAQYSGVQKDTAATRYEAFLGKLADRVEQTTGQNFDTVNDDPAFEQWIKASPSRLRLFQESVKSMDTEGVLTFFDLYCKQNLPAPISATPLQVDPRLARQVAPGKSKSTPSPAQQDGAKRRWTRSGIVDFYRKKKQYPSDTAAALERDIFAAQLEGRVDNLK